MRKKMFSLMAVVLFMGSSFTASAATLLKTDCIALAFKVEEILGCELEYDDFAELVDWCEENIN